MAGKKRSSASGTSRRTFLKSVAIASTAAVIPTAAACRKEGEVDEAGGVGSAGSAASSGAPQSPAAPGDDGIRVPVGQGREPGSDFMVDVIKSLGVSYVASNPAHAFRGLHESIIDYGGNKKPEFLLVLHEEIAVAMAHGYFKISGKPMIALVHASVGLQHAAMAVYNAWCDRVPVLVMGGNSLDESRPERGREIIAVHSTQDPNVIVRDFTKWDDTPVSLQHFADSFVRAYKLAMTPPHEPVMLTIDSSYQQAAAPDRSKLTIPKYTPAAPPQGDPGAVRDAARLLVGAKLPVIVVDRAARTPHGVDLLVQLCELLQAPCVDLRSRMNFPNTHHLCRHIEDAEHVVGSADVVLGLEVANFWGTVNNFVDNNKDGDGEVKVIAKAGTRLVSISSVTLSMKANYQDLQRYQPVDIDIVGDAEATLPQLIEEVRKALNAKARAAISTRGTAMRAQYKSLQDAAMTTAKKDWDASPMGVGRVTMEVLEAIRKLDWSLVGGSRWMVRWARRLWPLERYHHYLGLSGGDGRGYELPAAIGAALANRELGRFSVNLQSDGALMYTPQALWTAAHHKIPLLTIMMNNRAYHTEVEHLTKVSSWRGRKANQGPDSGPIGTMLENPAIDFAKLAQSMGHFATGPITKAADLGPALKAAIDVVKGGESAVIDVITRAR